MDLAVCHDSLVDERVFVQHVRNPHRRHLPLLHLINLHVFLDGLDCWNLPLFHHRALDMPMNCSSGISNLWNFFLLAHVVDCFPGWSDSLSLHFHLDDLDLHCILDLFVHLGPFLRRHLEDFGLLHLHWVHGWLDTCVRNLFIGYCLEILSNCRLSALRVLNMLRDFRKLDDLLHHL